MGFFPQSEELGEESEEDSGQKEEVSQAFLNLAGGDGEVDAYELRDILNAVFTRGQSRHSYVPLECCTSMPPGGSYCNYSLIN